MRHLKSMVAVTSLAAITACTFIQEWSLRETYTDLIYAPSVQLDADGTLHAHNVFEPVVQDNQYIIENPDGTSTVQDVETPEDVVASFSRSFARGGDGATHFLYTGDGTHYSYNKDDVWRHNPLTYYSSPILIDSQNRAHLLNRPSSFFANYAHLIFEDGLQVAERRFLLAPEASASNGGAVNFPRLFLDENDNAFVYYTYDDPDNDPVNFEIVRLFDDDTEEVVFSYVAPEGRVLHKPRMTTDDDGNFHVLLSEADINNQAIKNKLTYLKVSPDGAAFTVSEVGDVSDRAGKEFEVYNIVMDPVDEPFVIYSVTDDSYPLNQFKVTEYSYAAQNVYEDWNSLRINDLPESGDMHENTLQFDENGDLLFAFYEYEGIPAVLVTRKGYVVTGEADSLVVLPQ